MSDVTIELEDAYEEQSRLEDELDRLRDGVVPRGWSQRRVQARIEQIDDELDDLDMEITLLEEEEAYSLGEDED